MTSTGSDGLTPRERMEARGFELDDRGRPIEIGWEGRDTKPALTVRCKVGKPGAKACTRPLVRLWRDGSDYWAEVSVPDRRDGAQVRSPIDEQEGDVRQVVAGFLDDLSRPEDKSLGVYCAAHGVARVHTDALRLAASATRAFLMIDVTAGQFGYRSM